MNCGNLILVATVRQMPIYLQRAQGVSCFFLLAWGCLAVEVSLTELAEAWAVWIKPRQLFIFFTLPGATRFILVH